jgi:hypothetical protein
LLILKETILKLEIDFRFFNSGLFFFMRCFCNFLISRTLVIMFTSPVSPLTILSINLKSKVTLIIKRILYRYIYICLKIKPNSVRIRFLSCQIFVLPSTGFELTPLIHCSTNRLSLMSSALAHSTTSAPSLNGASMIEVLPCLVRKI